MRNFFDPYKEDSGLSGMTLLRILQILQDHSGAMRPLKQTEILDYLDEEYDLVIDRKTLSRKLALLENAGYEIERIPRKGVYISRSLTDAELHFLADAVLSNKYITKEETLDLIKRITAYGSNRFKDRIKQVAMLDEMDKAAYSEFFRNIELIDQAKKREKRLSFVYYRYDSDMEMHRGKEHEVSPYQLIFHNQRYYLVAKDEAKGDMVHYRVDRIRDMKVTQTDITDIHAVPGYKSGMPYRAISALPYFFPDAPRLIMFRAEKGLLETLIDFFGKKNIHIKSVKDDVIEGSVNTSPMALTYWAKQSAPSFEVLAPKDIREKIRADLAAAMAKYNS